MAVSNYRVYADGYDELKNIVKKLGKDKRIFVLFYGSKDSQGHSWYTKNDSFHGIWFQSILYRCHDCFAIEKPVEKIVESLLPSDGIFVQCSVGNRAR